MKSWEDMNRVRKRGAHLSWWDQKEMLFSRDFRWPVDAKTIFIVVGGSAEILYPVQKTTRILEFHKNASAYIFAECGAHCDGLKKLVTPKDANGNRVTFIEAPFPLSTSIQEAIARGDLPANPDCSVMLVPYRSYDDPKYISFLPLGGFLEEVSRHTLALNNTNHVTAFNHPLNDLRHVRGIPFYGYASLTDDDMEVRQGGGRGRDRRSRAIPWRQYGDNRPCVAKGGQAVVLFQLRSHSSRRGCGDPCEKPRGKK